MCARTAGVAEAKRLPNAPDPPAEGGAFRVGPPHRCEGKLPQLRVHEDYARRGARGPSASRSASCGAPSDGPCWLLRSVRTGVQAARAVDNDGAEIQSCPLTHGPSSWCRPAGALRYSRCHQHAQLRLGPVPTTAHTCVLPTAQIREAALTHRQMRTSLSPAAAAIQPWMGGGKSAQKPPGLAEPAVHYARAARLCQPRALGQLVEAADRSSAGKWSGESVRGAGPARSQQATAGSGQSPWSRLSATSTQFLAASATTVVSCSRTRAVQHPAETQVGRQAAIPTHGAARGQGVVEGA